MDDNSGYSCITQDTSVQFCMTRVDCVQCVFHSCRNDVCQFLYTPVQSTAASVYLCQSVSHYYVFFDAFVCTLDFACIQIVKRLLVSPSIVRTVEHFSSLDHFLFLSLRVVFDDERCCLYYFNNKTDSASQG